MKTKTIAFVYKLIEEEYEKVQQNYLNQTILLMGMNEHSDRFTNEYAKLNKLENKLDEICTASADFYNQVW